MKSILRRSSSLVALFAGVFAVGCADIETATESRAEEVGEARDALAPGCVKIVRGGAGNVYDSHFAPGNGTWVTGSYTSTWTGNDNRSVFAFDLSPVPANANVISSTLDVYVAYNTGATTVEAHEMTTAWDEATSTWATVGGVASYSPAVLGSFNPAWGSDGHRTVELLALTRNWLDGSKANHGVVLDQASGASRTYNTSESTSVSRRPSLTVCWDGELPPVTTNLCANVVCAVADACTNPGHCDPATGQCTTAATGAVWPGDYAITDAASLAALQSYSAINGSLYIDGSATVTSVALPNLVRLGGYLYVAGTSLTSLSADKLTSVGGYVYFNGNPALTSVDLGDLAAVCDYVYLDHNDALVNMGLGSLQATGSSVTVYRAAMPSLDLGSLRTVGADLSFYHTAVATLDVSSLESVGGFLYLDHNAALTGFGPSPLTSVGGYFYADHNDALTGFDLPALETVGNYMYVTNNGLTHLGFGSLQSVAGYGYFASNPSLPSCSVSAIAPVFAGGVTNAGNTGAGPCN